MAREDKRDIIKERQQDDLSFARENYYELLAQGQESLETMIQIFKESEHPRCGEIVAQLLKQNSDLTDKLVDLQKKNKDLTQENLPVPQQQGAGPTGGNTTNNVFVGTTEELQRLLQGDSLSVEKDITPKE